MLKRQLRQKQIDPKKIEAILAEGLDRLLERLCPPGMTRQQKGAYKQFLDAATNAGGTSKGDNN